MFVCVESLTGSGYTLSLSLSLGILRFMWRPDACLEVHMNGLGAGRGGGGGVLGAGSEHGGALRGLPPKMETTRINTGMPLSPPLPRRSFIHSSVHNSCLMNQETMHEATPQ